jgi:hypothetical protein
VPDGKLPGQQGDLLLFQGIGSAVAQVAKDGVAAVSELKPDLMASPGLEMNQ